jgi:sulfur carrier protein ThiS
MVLPLKPPEGASRMSNINVTYLNNDGNGFGMTIGISAGTTVKQFLTQVTGDENFDDRTIRVNGGPVTEDYTLGNGDRVSVTYQKIAGA